VDSQQIVRNPILNRQIANPLSHSAAGAAKRMNKKDRRRICYDGERVTLAGGESFRVTHRQIIKQLRLELGAHLRGREENGIISDPTDVFEILCLEEAMKFLQHASGKVIAKSQALRDIIVVASKLHQWEKNRK
jgi:hypothetical protein